MMTYCLDGDQIFNDGSIDILVTMNSVGDVHEQIGEESDFE